MDQMLHKIRQVLNGTRPLDMKTKYGLLCFATACVHFIITIVFGNAHIWPLFYYNIAITIFYLCHCLLSVRKGQYALIYFSSMIEIMLHSGLASILLGWDWGFMLYTVALIPVAYYLCFTLKGHDKSITLPLVSSMAVMVCYLTIRIVCGRITPLYHDKDFGNVKSTFYYFNTFVAFAILLIFSTLFSMEIRYMQRKLQKENNELEEIASFDPLTHLRNRRSMNPYMQSAMTKAKEKQEPFCFIMADIDDFKKVNDTYGHDCGDEVLIRVADIVSSNIRERDYACRWGGEEILLLVDTDKDTAVKIADRICKDVQGQIIHYKNKDVRVTLTLGVAAYQGEDTVRDVIEQADKKLYYGKNNGKNQVVS